MADYAHKARDVAHDVLALVQQLEAERSARKALQVRCDELQTIIGKAAYESATSDGFEDIEWPA